ncbi:MAG: GNAT family N-acetyltransferase/peptidase C39 family protein [Rhodospirillaceae bacterium]
MNTAVPAMAGDALVRRGRVDDIPALVALENRCFDSDRMSRRSFQHMLTKAHGVLTVAVGAEGLSGYSLVLFHAGTSLARLYSIAVDDKARGQGLGEMLLHAAEDAAVAEGCVSMRLEVRPDNAGAIALYERLGYRPFAVLPDYYEDHSAAVRYEKRIAHAEAQTQLPVPFHRQNTDFTCGPASLMMAMQALDPSVEFSTRLELSLWREATTIFMTSGHGGCGPLGLALSAWRRGFESEVWLSEDGPLFVRTVRDPRKKEVIRMVHEDFKAQVEAAGITVHRAPLTVQGLVQAVEEGAVPLVLISQYRMTSEKSPHWVVVTGFDDHFIYFNDPDVDEDFHKTAIDCINIPIGRREFDRTARYGRVGLRAAVVVRKR